MTGVQGAELWRTPPLGRPPGLQGARAGLELARPAPPPTPPREGNRQPRLLGLAGSVVVMWDEMTLTFSRTSMFPFFDIAHYLVSVMALKQRPGSSAVAWNNPLSSWLSAMLHCFGGGILSCILLAEPPLKFLTNHTNILLASSIWYIVFFCPRDLVSQGYSYLPIQLLAAGMKEVTRTWKIVGGVTHANSYYRNGWIVMIAVGWARGAGGVIVTSCEEFLKGDWKPEGDEWLKLSFPAKVTLLGSIIFTLQHTNHLAMSKHDLMFLYTMFLVTIKITMMITKDSTVTLAPFEDTLSRMLFGWQQQFSLSEKKPEEKPSSNGTASSVSKPTIEDTDTAKRHAKKED
ncbi:trimeric intracellular cation channel type B [Phodopus roborovskii]|uniref:trimeric intracellular cation channel type B n=1 Tax=Phodopus roborovskii TaxID=109678 RepID=UPI0021E41AF1|nr:trimeric intracellular cation channel type B [Phodopus roborovskii]